MFGHRAHDYKDAYFIVLGNMCAMLVKAGTVSCFIAGRRKYNYSFLSLRLHTRKARQGYIEHLLNQQKQTKEKKKKKPSGPHREL